MSADILSDPTHPHGTTEGFKRGCKGAGCPAPVSCTTVHTRYNGDYAFRKAYDAGVTPEQIAQQEGGTHQKRTRRSTTKRASTGPLTPVTDLQRRVWDLVVNKGRTDRQVADIIHKTRDQAAGVRKGLRLPANPATRTPATAGVSSS